MMHAHQLTGRGGSGSRLPGGAGRMFTWSARLLIAAAAADALWSLRLFCAPVLRMSCFFQLSEPPKAAEF